jgi:hypothetical protein
MNAILSLPQESAFETLKESEFILNYEQLLIGLEGAYTPTAPRSIRRRVHMQLGSTIEKQRKKGYEATFYREDNHTRSLNICAV